jgi:hypothetical protein
MFDMVVKEELSFRNSFGDAVEFLESGNPLSNRFIH